LETYLDREVSLSEIANTHPVLINGDDILFKCSRDFYNHWKGVITEFGFKPSPGKNLFHRNLCQINSVLFHCVNGGVAAEDVRTIDYVNFGLITNRKKQDCEIDTSLHRTGLTEEVINGSLLGRLKSLKKIQDRLLSGLTQSLQEKANRLFAKHCAWVRQSFPGIDIYNPEMSGGLGLNSIGLDEQTETSIESGHRRALQRYLFMKNTSLSATLLSIERDPIVSLISQEMGNYFPSLRLNVDETLLDESERSVKNCYWKIIGMTKTKISQLQPLIIKPEITVRNRLPCERITRFSKIGDIEQWRVNAVAKGYNPDEIAMMVFLNIVMRISLGAGTDE
jgi:hypothetical protein